MRALIDTCVILDWLQNRKEFSFYAEKIIAAALLKKFHAFVTFHSLSDVAYITRKDFSYEERLEILKMLCEKFTVVQEGGRAILDAAKLELMKDFEDSLQIVAAKNCEADFIVTRNKKDFVQSRIKIATPKEFIQASALDD